MYTTRNNKNLSDNQYTDSYIVAMPSGNISTMNNLYYSVPTAAGVRKIQQVWLNIGHKRADDDPTLIIGRINHMKAILKNYIQRFKSKYTGMPYETPKAYPEISKTIPDNSPLSLLTEAEITALENPSKPFSIAVPETPTTKPLEPFVETVHPDQKITNETNVVTVTAPEPKITTPPAITEKPKQVYYSTYQKLLAEGKLTPELEKRAIEELKKEEFIKQRAAEEEAAAKKAVEENGKTNVVTTPGETPGETPGTTPPAEAKKDWMKYLPWAVGLGALALAFSGGQND
jgi:hypothetical protein